MRRRRSQTVTFGRQVLNILLKTDASAVAGASVSTQGHC